MLADGPVHFDYIKAAYAHARAEKSDRDHLRTCEDWWRRRYVACPYRVPGQSPPRALTLVYREGDGLVAMKGVDAR